MTGERQQLEWGTWLFPHPHSVHFPLPTHATLSQHQENMFPVHSKFPQFSDKEKALHV